MKKLIELEIKDKRDKRVDLQIKQKRTPIDLSKAFKTPSKLTTLSILTVLIFLVSVGGIIAGIASLSSREAIMTINNATSIISSNFPSTTLTVNGGDYYTYYTNISIASNEIRPFYLNFSINKTGLTSNQIKLRILNGTTGAVINETTDAINGMVSLLRNFDGKSGSIVDYNTTLEINTTVGNASIFTIQLGTYPVPFGFK